MHVRLDEGHLNTLRLRLPDLVELPEDVQISQIKKAYRALSLQFHPDKNGGEDIGGRFAEISVAYAALIGGVSSYEINHYFTSYPVIIPNTAFDLLLQSGIEANFQDLITTFSALTSEKKKKDFGAYYGPFLNLAQCLEEKKEEINDARQEQFSEQRFETLGFHLTQEWRAFIIRLFGEEYLDDFQYREALVSGRLWPILATRKLFSPVKWIVAILNSLNLVLCSSIGHYFIHVVFKKLTDFMTLLESDVDFCALSMVLLSLIVSMLPVYAICFVTPQPILFIVMGLPLLALTLDLIASPINNVIRPLANFMKLPPLVCTAGFSIVGAGAMYGLINYVMHAGVAALFPYLTIALNLYSFYLAVMIAKNIYQQDPTLGIALGLMFGLIMAVGLIPTSTSAEVVIEPLTEFLSALADCSLSYVTNLIIKDNITEAQRMEVLPLPTEDVPESIQKATLLGYKKASQSHRLFSTPQDADYQKQRSFWQQTASFFGGGARDTAKEVPCFDNAPSNSLALA